MEVREDLALEALHILRLGPIVEQIGHLHVQAYAISQIHTWT